MVSTAATWKAMAGKYKCPPLITFYKFIRELKAVVAGDTPQVCHAPTAGKMFPRHRIFSLTRAKIFQNFHKLEVAGVLEGPPHI